jgi:hypothetical protein
LEQKKPLWRVSLLRFWQQIGWEWCRCSRARVDHQLDEGRQSICVFICNTAGVCRFLCYNAIMTGLDRETHD